ncbi:MAG: branched-chain amino acid ABC transporter permease [Rhodovarius sp.]|nr:branched-chain amino acid ABC transporter permease [Rhodovarius sp.]MCX7932474.1 branched-chain amino acid ABC transporter permease [Rhodovarius sp.]MDW8314801.1 branched-chain amino acid ABC transporter permease [Rhodovarius sp.]
MEPVLLYLATLLTLAGVYAALSLGLNLQWGMTGVMNFGLLGFIAAGAYTSALLTAPPSPQHLGGFGWPWWLAWPLAALAGALLALPIGAIALRLRADYLAIATIGIAEIVRLFVRNEDWLTGGPLGVPAIPRPFEALGQPVGQVAYLLLVAAVVAGLYAMAQATLESPFGRSLRAVRDDEEAAKAAGKNPGRLRLQAFVLGAACMGLAGAMLAHFFKFMAPDALDPVATTVLVWVMLIAGGSGNNRGAILGALLVWALWAASDWLAAQLPGEMATRAAYVRLFLIGCALQLVLLYRPHGLLPGR